MAHLSRRAESQRKVPASRRVTRIGATAISHRYSIFQEWIGEVFKLWPMAGCETGRDGQNFPAYGIVSKSSIARV